MQTTEMKNALHQRCEPRFEVMQQTLKVLTDISRSPVVTILFRSRL